MIILQKRTYWYDNCQKEIPAWAQLDILDNIYPNHWRNQSSVKWEEIYRCWDASNALKDKCHESKVTKCATSFKEISSIKVSGLFAVVNRICILIIHIATYSFIANNHAFWWCSVNLILLSLCGWQIALLLCSHQVMYMANAIFLFRAMRSQLRLSLRSLFAVQQWL